MVSLLKVVGLTSCGLLCLGLSYTAIVQADDEASAADKLKTDPSDRQSGQEIGEKQMHEMESHQSAGSKTIKGEVLRIEGNDCFIEGQDGTEVRLHIDLPPLKARNIEPDERIEANVNDQNHVLTILSDPAVMDRRNDKE